MASFYGEVSVVATLGYYIEAENEEEAKEKLFNANCPISLVDDEDKPICELTDQSWHMVDESSRGNVQESDLTDFWIKGETE